jgi:hypothetical protein
LGRHNLSLGITPRTIRVFKPCSLTPHRLLTGSFSQLGAF